MLINFDLYNIIAEYREAIIVIYGLRSLIFVGPLPGGKVIVQMASLAVTWMPSLNLGHTKSQRSGQAYHTVLPRKAYYSCQVSRVCVASV